VLREDGLILEQQSLNLERFAGPAFVSTELDLFSGQIQELLKRADAGDSGEDSAERRIELMM